MLLPIIATLRESENLTSVMATCPDVVLVKQSGPINQISSCWLDPFRNQNRQKTFKTKRQFERRSIFKKKIQINELQTKKSALEIA